MGEDEAARLRGLRSGSFEALVCGDGVASGCRGLKLWPVSIPVVDMLQRGRPGIVDGGRLGLRFACGVTEPELSRPGTVRLPVVASLETGFRAMVELRAPVVVELRRFDGWGRWLPMLEDRRLLMLWFVGVPMSRPRLDIITDDGGEL